MVFTCQLAAVLVDVEPDDEVAVVDTPGSGWVVGVADPDRGHDLPCEKSGDGCDSHPDRNQAKTAHTWSLPAFAWLTGQRDIKVFSSHRPTRIVTDTLPAWLESSSSRTT